MVGGGVNLASLSIVGIINIFAVTVWALSGFGNGMIYQIGYHTCSRFSRWNGGSGQGHLLCDGTVATAVAHITIAATIIFPIQTYYLKKHIDWQLVLHFALSQVLGLISGLHLLLLLDPILTARLLGVVMCIAALQRFSAEFSLSSTALHVMSPTDDETPTSPSKIKYSPRTEPALTIKYPFESWVDYVYVWFIGSSSGVFGGLYAAGGPPLLYFVASTNMEKNACRASMALLFTIENIERWIFLLASHDTKVIDPTSETFIPYVIILNITSLTGMFIGNMVMDKVSQSLFRRIIDVILTVGSLMLATTECDALTTSLIVLLMLCLYGGMYLYLRRKLEHSQLELASQHTNMQIRDSFSVENDDDFDTFMTNASRSKSGNNNKTMQMVQSMRQSVTKTLTSMLSSSTSSSTPSSSTTVSGSNGSFNYSMVNTNCEDET
jgi:uncharacterized membrane protein YfcA